MKKINLVLSVLVLLLVLAGCDKNPAEVKEKDPDGVLGGEEPKPELTTLFNTKWKLVGFFDIEKNELTEAEPRDCEECYTLTFETDSTFIGRTVSNIVFGNYDINTKYIANIVISEALDTPEGELYGNILFKVNSFTVEKTNSQTLNLYYNNGKNALKYKKIGG